MQIHITSNIDLNGVDNPSSDCVQFAKDIGKELTDRGIVNMVFNKLPSGDETKKVLGYDLYDAKERQEFACKLLCELYLYVHIRINILRYVRQPYVYFSGIYQYIVYRVNFS